MKPRGRGLDVLVEHDGDTILFRAYTARARAFLRWRGIERVKIQKGTTDYIADMVSEGLNVGSDYSTPRKQAEEEER